MIYGKEELLPRVEHAVPLDNYNLLLTFNNGERRQFDVTPLFQLPMYHNLKKVFPLVTVQYGTVLWPGDLDISPDTLYLQGTPVSK